MFQAMSLIPNFGMGRAAFYMNRTILTGLRRQLAAMGNQSYLTLNMAGGIMTESFQGIPIRRVDALSADEALVGT